MELNIVYTFFSLYLNLYFEFYVNMWFQWLHLNHSQADSKAFPYDHINSSFSGCAEQCGGIKQADFVNSQHGRLNKGPCTHRQSGPHSHRVLHLWHGHIRLNCHLNSQKLSSCMNTYRHNNILPCCVIQSLPRIRCHHAKFGDIFELSTWKAGLNCSQQE